MLHQLLLMAIDMRANQLLCWPGIREYCAQEGKAVVGAAVLYGGGGRCLLCTQIEHKHKHRGIPTSSHLLNTCVADDMSDVQLSSIQLDRERLVADNHKVQVSVCAHYRAQVCLMPPSGPLLPMKSFGCISGSPA